MLSSSRMAPPSMVRLPPGEVAEVLLPLRKVRKRFSPRPDPVRGKGRGKQ